jgi:hypothetical protein
LTVSQLEMISGASQLRPKTFPFPEINLFIQSSGNKPLSISNIQTICYSTNLSNVFRHPRKEIRPYFEHSTIVALVLSEMAGHRRRSLIKYAFGSR